MAWRVGFGEVDGRWRTVRETNGGGPGWCGFIDGSGPAGAGTT